MSNRKNPKCEFCGDPAYMSDNGVWKCKKRIESQIAKKGAEAYCKANGLVMVPEEPTHAMEIAGIKSGYIDKAIKEGPAHWQISYPAGIYEAMIAAYKEQAW